MGNRHCPGKAGRDKAGRPQRRAAPTPLLEGIIPPRRPKGKHRHRRVAAPGPTPMARDWAILPAELARRAGPSSQAPRRHSEQARRPNGRNRRARHQPLRVKGFAPTLVGEVARPPRHGQRAHLLFQRGVGIGVRAEAPVRGQHFRPLAEPLFMTLDHLSGQRAVGRSLGEHLVVRDEFLRRPAEEHRVPELHRLFPPPTLDQLGVRLEDAEHPLARGDLLPLQLRPPRLDDHLPHRSQVALQLVGHAQQFQLAPARRELAEHTGNSHDPLDPSDQRPKRAFHLPLSLLRWALGVPRDEQVQALALPVVEAVRAAFRHDFPAALEQTRRHPPRVPQKRRVGRPVDVRLHHLGVRADLGRADRLLRDRLLSQQLVDPLPSRRADRLQAPVQKTVVHHRPLAGPQEILKEFALRDPHHRLPQGEPLDGVDHQGPQDRLRGVVAGASLAAPMGELLEVLMHGLDELEVPLQNPAHPLVLGAIIAYRFGEMLVAGGHRQHGFSYLAHPCPPWGSS